MVATMNETLVYSSREWKGPYWKPAAYYPKHKANANTNTNRTAILQVRSPRIDEGRNPVMLVRGGIGPTDLVDIENFLRKYTPHTYLYRDHYGYNLLWSPPHCKPRSGHDFSFSLTEGPIECELTANFLILADPQSYQSYQPHYMTAAQLRNDMGF
jgi:hypothetical protein